MTPKERARLRGLANGIDTVLQIGKDGIGENLIRQADITLEARELIKGRVLDGCMDYTPRTAAETLAEATRSEVVQVIGSKFVLYRKKSEEAPTKQAETPKKHAKPCQRKRAQRTEAHARPDKTPSTPRHGGSRKPSTENRAGQRKASPNGNEPRTAAANRSGQRKAAAKRNAYGGNNRPTRNGMNRPTRGGKNRK